MGHLEGLYDNSLNTGCIYITDHEIEQDTVQRVLAELHMLGFSCIVQKKKPHNLFVKISSIGGNVYDTIAIADAIKELGIGLDIPTVGICYGFVGSSAASFLLQSLDNRVALPGTRFHFHAVYDEDEKEGKVISAVEQSETTCLQNLQLDILAERSTISRDEWANLFDEKQDVYFSAKEAFDAGLVDEVKDLQKHNIVVPEGAGKIVQAETDTSKLKIVRE